MEDGPTLPSGNAPEDLRNAGNVGRMWIKIDGLVTDVSTMKTDIALIKQNLALSDDSKKRKERLENMAIIAFLAGVITLGLNYLSAHLH